MVVKDNPFSEIQYPDWQNVYLAALLELEPGKLRARIVEAEGAISKRLHAIAGNVNHTGERQAMADALANLRVLKREKLNHPVWEKESKPPSG
jgi:hypothetical protein